MSLAPARRQVVLAPARVNAQNMLKIAHVGARKVANAAADVQLKKIASAQRKVVLARARKA